MRQAGRYMPEYRALRERHSLLDLCHDPALATEVTLQPVSRLGVDAAILFADILLPFEPLGLGLSFAKGEGPRIAHPIRSPGDVGRLRPVAPAADLGTRDFARTKALMYQAPDAWHLLLSRFAELVGCYLRAQAEAGADAVQMFDSWVGCLSPQDYREFVQPHSRRALELAGAAGVPVIHFATGTAPFLEDFAAAGGDVIGVDWRVELDRAWSRIGHDRGIQGNLDPAALLAPGPALDARVRDILARAGGRPGHIFNLGHGVLPETPVVALQRVVDIVHGD
jgi:uroporphyrinogen decarboxylase